MILRFCFLFFLILSPYLAYSGQCISYLKPQMQMSSLEKSIEDFRIEGFAELIKLHELSLKNPKIDRLERKLLDITDNKLIIEKIIKHNDVIQKWLALNSVDFKYYPDTFEFVILPTGNSPLNRFARRLQLTKTELVYDPLSLVENRAQAIFSRPREAYGVDLSKETSIFLSIKAIQDLKPTLIETHELVHWKLYFKFLKAKNSAFNGSFLSLNKKETAIEELKAHLTTFLKNLRAYRDGRAIDQNLKAIDAKYLDEFSAEILDIKNSVLKHSTLFNEKSFFSFRIWNHSDFNLLLRGKKNIFQESIELKSFKSGHQKYQYLEYTFKNKQTGKLISLKIGLTPELKTIASLKDLLNKENSAHYEKLMAKIKARIESVLEFADVIEDIIIDIEISRSEQLNDFDVIDYDQIIKALNKIESIEDLL